MEQQGLLPLVGCAHAYSHLPYKQTALGRREAALLYTTFFRLPWLLLVTRSLASHTDLPVLRSNAIFSHRTESFPVKASKMMKSVTPQLSTPSSGSRVLRLSPEQAHTLEEQFQRVKNPHATDVLLLAAETGLDERDVQMWFAQRLSVWRREQGLSSNMSTLNSFH